MKHARVLAALCLVLFTFVTLPAFAAPADQPMTNFANTVTGMSKNLMGNNNGPLPVTWPQNNIGINQLQNIFSQNPNASAFNIHFPNGFNWEITPQNLQSFYNQYVAQAKDDGFGNNPPALNFSSLPAGTTALSKNSVTVPINNAIGSMQQQAQQMLDQINAERYSFMDGLPDWLKKTITLICNGFLILWDFAVDQVRSWF